MRAKKVTLSLNDVHQALWSRGELSFLLHQTQKKIHTAITTSTSDEVLVLSSRQLGKSYWAVVYALEFAIKNPGCIVRILAPTLKAVSDIVNDNLSPITATAPTGLIVRQKSSYRWKVGSSELRLGALERATVDNNRGGNAALIITEEGGFVGSDDFAYAVQSVIGPQLLRSSGKLIHVTTPSEDPAHYLHTEVKPKTELAKSFFSFTIYDNPQITPEQIEKAKLRCGGASSISWKREYLAQIIRDEDSSVIPLFSSTQHVQEHNLPSYRYWTIGVDLGFARDLSAAVLCYFDYLENKVVVQDSLVWERGTSTSQIITDLRILEAKYNISRAGRYIDADARLRDDLATLHSYPVNQLQKDDLQAQLNALNVAFGNDNVRILPHNTHLISSLENGRWNRNRTDFERSNSLGHLDSLMALVYAFRMQDRTNPYPDYYGLNPASQNLSRLHNPAKKSHPLKSALNPRF